MKINKKELVYSGKAKSLFNTDQANVLIAEFRDDTTAFDGVKHEKLTNKGLVNNQINAYLMQFLANNGVPTHFIQQLSSTETAVKKLTMIPLESVVRNIAAGSLCRRLGIEESKHLTPPLYELFLKNDELHDPLVTERHAIAFDWASEAQLQQMESLALKIHLLLTDLFRKAGLLLVDAKYEFGVDADGSVCLGDEISPDSCRIWDATTGEKLDKDRFRQDLGNVIESYQIIAHKLGIDIQTDVAC